MKFLCKYLLFAIFVFCSSNVFAGEEEKYQANLIKKFYSMGTASVSGTYYPVGNAISRLFAKNIKKLVVVAEPTAGSMANVEYLRKKQINIALIQNDVAWMAFNGTLGYANNSFKNLRVLTSLYSEKIQIIVKADSEIKSLSDLKDKKISIGEKDSGSAAGAAQILEAAGLGNEDYRLVFERFGKSIESLQDGYVDAIYYVGAVPNDGIARLASKFPVRLIEIPHELITKLTGKYPCYSAENISANSYNGQTNSIGTLGIRALLACTDELPEDEAITMLTVLYSSNKLLSEEKDVILELNRSQALKGVDSEMLHDGAKMFFSVTPVP